MLIQEVCHRYWPQNGMQQYGEFSVSVMEESMHEGHLERVFSVTDSKVGICTLEEQGEFLIDDLYY